MTDRRGNKNRRAADTRLTLPRLRKVGRSAFFTGIVNSASFVAALPRCRRLELPAMHTRCQGFGPTLCSASSVCSAVATGRQHLPAALIVSKAIRAGVLGQHPNMKTSTQNRNSQEPQKRE